MAFSGFSEKNSPVAREGVAAAGFDKKSVSGYNNNSFPVTGRV